MARYWKAGCWLSVLGLAWLTPGSARGFGDHFSPHGKIGARFCAWLEIQHVKNHAPWYTYFPSGAATMEGSAGPMYPTWPSSFPPPQSAPALQQMMPTSSGSPGIYQPVGNFNTSVPSYWFAR
jgi:hypothetical protein